MPTNTPDASSHSGAIAYQPITARPNEATVRNIGRLFDVCLAVGSSEVSLYIHEANTEFAHIDWEDLLNDWCAEARSNDEDVYWSRSTSDSSTGTHEFFSVRRRLQFSEQTIAVIYLMRGVVPL